MCQNRVFVAILVALSVLWIPIVRNGPELYHYLNAVLSFMAPPVSAIFIAAIFWPRANEPGAFWALVLGFLVGSIRFICEFTFPVPSCGNSDERPWLIKMLYMNYLHFAILLFLISLGLCIGVSSITKPIPKSSVCLSFSYHENANWYLLVNCFRFKNLRF